MEGNEIFTYITNNDIDNVKKVLAEEKLKGDLYDEHGMTPLQHAAYKGNKQICQLLLDHGADVNSGKHEHGYTALHFAALSGKDDVCSCLLSSGARSHATNSVGRTASQMAAFVGNHKCVAVINNFMHLGEVEYYCVPRGLETAPKLDPILAKPMHSFIMQVNIHPVRVALNLQPSLISHIPQVRKVLNLMSEKQMKSGAETNEIMSFKLHYLSCVIGEVAKCKQGAKECDLVELFARKIHRPIHGERYMEMFIRDCVREFPYRECMIFKQMVSSLARSRDPETMNPALNILGTAINGHRAFADDVQACSTCCEEGASKKCSKCKAVRYCDRECQRLHWFIHKKECARNTPTHASNGAQNGSPAADNGASVNPTESDKGASENGGKNSRTSEKSEAGNNGTCAGDGGTTDVAKDEETPIVKSKATKGQNGDIVESKSNKITDKIEAVTENGDSTGQITDKVSTLQT